MKDHAAQSIGQYPLGPTIKYCTIQTRKSRAIRWVWKHGKARWLGFWGTFYG